MGSRLSGKFTRGSPYYGFYCIFVNKFFENFLGGRGRLLHPPHTPYDETAAKSLQ
jgi:hypothetical protein